MTLQKKVKEKNAEVERKGIIQKVAEPTSWISSMIVVAKPGKIRISLDPRDLSKAIQRPKYLMPTFEEISPNLAKRRFLPLSMPKMVFTRLD